MNEYKQACEITGFMWDYTNELFNNEGVTRALATVHFIEWLVKWAKKDLTDGSFSISVYGRPLLYRVRIADFGPWWSTADATSLLQSLAKCICAIDEAKTKKRQ